MDSCFLRSALHALKATRTNTTGMRVHAPTNQSPTKPTSSTTSASQWAHPVSGATVDVSVCSVHRVYHRGPYCICGSMPIADKDLADGVAVCQDGSLDVYSLQSHNAIGRPRPSFEWTATCCPSSGSSS